MGVISRIPDGSLDNDATMNGSKLDDSDGLYAPSNGIKAHYTALNGSNGFHESSNGTNGSFATLNGSNGFHESSNDTNGAFAALNGSNGFHESSNGSNGAFATLNGSNGFHESSNGSNGAFATLNGSNGFHESSNDTNGAFAALNGSNGFHESSNGTNGAFAASNGTNGLSAFSKEKNGFIHPPNGSSISYTPSSGSNGISAASNRSNGFSTPLNGSNGFMPTQETSSRVRAITNDNHNLCAGLVGKDLFASDTRGLGECMSWQMHLCRNTTAFIDGDYSITYADLKTKAQLLANQLRGYPIALEEPVGILVESGIDHVVAQIAILFAGGTCVPLDTSLPDQQLGIRLADAGTRYLIVNTQNQYRFPEFDQIVVPLAGASIISFTEHQNDILDTSLEHRTHMLYTSGTTGKPKAVQILARGIRRLAYSRTWSPIAAGDRVAHVNPVSFDASIFDIWVSLLCGATIVVINKTTLLDPFAFSDFLHRHGITIMFITTAIFNLTALACPRAFSGVHNLLTGGEVFSINAMKSVLEEGPPKNLFHVYGPTECSVFATAHKVTLRDVATGSIGIGKAIGGTHTYILDESLGPVPPTEIGELFIGGDGLSRGYLNRHELTNKAFVSVAGLTPNGAPVLLYRTGDLVRDDGFGTIEYVCRRDNQVKIHGMRIELEAVELALLGTKLVSAAAALKVQPSDDVPALLVAYVVLTADGNARSSDILKSLETSLPRYMVPRLEVIDKIPLNANGKLDRKALTARYLLQSAQTKDNLDVDSTDQQETTVLRLERTWLEVLNYPVERIDPRDDFFDLGGTSMHAANLIYQIQKAFQVRLPAQALYENTSLLALAAHIDASRAGKLQPMDEKECWLADANLSQELEPLAGQLPEWRSTTEGRVFITGATGFVGAFLLSQLLQLPEVRSVACLVRAKDPVSGLMRIRKNLIKYELWQKSFEPKILVLPGNIAEPNLGLDYARFEEMASWASVVFHLGAHVNYTQPYSVHRGANVVGTANILRLTVTGRPKTLHYVSSIASYGPTGLITGTKRLPEDEPMLPHIDALTYDTGYSQSQWVAEYMVWKCIERDFPIAVYRPGFVLGHSVTGMSNRDDFIGRLMVSCITQGTYPILPRQRKEFVPVDYVVSALLHISSSLGNLHHAYNLVPPSSSISDVTSIDLVGTFDLLNKCGPFDLRGLPYDEWCENVAQELLKDNGDGHPLMALMPMFHEKVYGERTRWEVYENMPIYETDNTSHALRDREPPLACPVFDETLLKLYLESWRRK